MKLWDSHAVAIASAPHRANSRHVFVIGPLCDTSLSARKARIYYCRLCDWSFLVAGSKVAVLDARGEPVVGAESLRRFSTFAEGPCPALEAFAAAALGEPVQPRLSLRRKFDELGNLASSHFRARSRQPRPLLRLLGGMRENLGRHS
jgi:hypothetical protein